MIHFRIPPRDKRQGGGVRSEADGPEILSTRKLSVAFSLVRPRHSAASEPISELLLGFFDFRRCLTIATSNGLLKRRESVHYASCIRDNIPPHEQLDVSNHNLDRKHRY